MKTNVISFLLGAAMVLPLAAQQGPEVGQVHFQTSCSAAVQPDFDRAVAMLHSFWYGEAEKTFESVAARDPKCAMAYWGQAMTRYHQLWGPNNVDDAGGKAAVAHARELAAKASPRERQFIEAIGVYYDGAGGSSPGQRARAYAAQMAKVSMAFPDDPEAAVFHALALIATADPSDRSFAQRKQAAAILKKVEAQQPRHPGVAHYLIHAYDSPELAQFGLPAARVYAKLAPAAPHALHMPAHIFTQLGLWDEAIATDLNAVAAAEKEEQEHHEHGVGRGRLHSYDYLEYAYLQRGDDAAARKILDEITGPDAPALTADAALQHALAAIPARYALERRDWAEAEKLPLRAGTDPIAESIIRMARGVGAARLGHIQGVKQEIAAMQDLENRTPGPWRSRAHIQFLIVAGMLAHAEHQDDEAVRVITTSAESPETAPGMPPAILPWREVLGDVLLDMGHAEEALQQYQLSDQSTPNRFNTLAGAFRAAKQAKRSDAARQYAEKLVVLTSGVTSDRREPGEARAFLQGGAKPGAAK